MELPTIHLSKCTLRQWNDNDIFSLAKNANNKAIADNLRDIFPYPYTLDSANFFLQQIANLDPNIIFAIEVDGEAVGSIGAHPFTDINRLGADFGYWISETYWNKGIISEAIPAIVNYVFLKTTIIRLQAGVFESNLASKRVLEKNGFVLESVMKKAIIKNNRIMDEFIFVKLKEN